MPDTYMKTKAYNALAEALANIEPCPFAGRVTADQVKLVLGEHLNLWPLSIAADVEGRG